MSKTRCFSVVFLVLVATALRSASARADTPSLHQRAVVFALSIYDKFPHPPVTVDPNKPTTTFGSLSCEEDARRISAPAS